MAQGDVAGLQEALLGSPDLRAEFRANPQGFLEDHEVTLDAAELARLKARNVGAMTDDALVQAIRDSGLHAMW